MISILIINLKINNTHNTLIVKEINSIFEHKNGYLKSLTLLNELN